MKTKAHMNFSEKDNFDKAVEGYINDNINYIKEMAVPVDADGLAKASLEHYNETVKGYGQVDEFLSDEQKEVFLATAKRLFAKGSYA